MRITSGRYRNRILATPDTPKTHPMGDRERLALFNRLASVVGARVLDLYAGSGALGIEALSRGARTAVFVEKSPKATRIINKNLSNLGVSDQGKVVNTDVKTYLKNLGRPVPTNSNLTPSLVAGAAPHLLFDIIFCDPPYDNFHPEDFITVANFLQSTGLFVLSHPSTPIEIPGLELLSTKSYAAANISIYRHAPVICNV